MKRSSKVLLIVICFLNVALSQDKTNALDKSWAKQSETIKNAYEAEYIIRVVDDGDHNFGFTKEFDLFYGRLKDEHPYLWAHPKPNLQGMDKIAVFSKGIVKYDCGSDGYYFVTFEQTKGSVKVSIATILIAGVEIKDAYLQLFTDDFQAPVFCS